MSSDTIRFNDGAAYERYMGVWSQSVGEAFLDWLQPPTGARWLDVGCGNGAFTERIIARTAPASVDGIDPAEAQIAHARARFSAGVATFHQGDAMALPFASGDADQAFDVAVMPLVIFFVPDPLKGVAEMARVVRPGGLVSAYAWDMPGGGFPYALLLTTIRAMGKAVPMPPSPDASRLDSLRGLWSAAGVVDVETTTIAVERTYRDFADYWTTVLGAPSAGSSIAGMKAEDQAELQARLREQLSIAADGSITCRATANAVKGRVSRA